jgi:TIR domain
MVAQRPSLPNCLLRALKQHTQTFLFVGFGIRHWHLRVLLKVLVRALELHRGGSTAATEPLHGLTDSDREQTVLFYERGTRIEVEDSDVEAFLGQTQDKLNASGGHVGKPSPIGSRPRVFISYARENSVLAGQVFNFLKGSHFEPWLDSTSLPVGIDWDGSLQAQLKAMDFVLILCTPSLCMKMDSYVNREIALAVDRSRDVRGSFIIPLVTFDITPDERIVELSKYNEARLGSDTFDEDMAKVVSVMTRDYQRRHR